MMSVFDIAFYLLGYYSIALVVGMFVSQAATQLLLFYGSRFDTECASADEYAFLQPNASPISILCHSWLLGSYRGSACLNAFCFTPEYQGCYADRDGHWGHCWPEDFLPALFEIERVLGEACC